MPTMGTGISTSYPSQAYRPSADGTGCQIVPPTLTQGKKQNPPIQSKGVQYEASYFSSTQNTSAWSGGSYTNLRCRAPFRPVAGLVTFECVGTMRLQSEGTPNPANRHPAKSTRLG